MRNNKIYLFFKPLVSVNLRRNIYVVLQFPLKLKAIKNDKYRKSFSVIFQDLKELKKDNSLTDMNYYFNSLMYKKGAGNINMYVNENAINRINSYHKKHGKHYYLDHKVRFSELMTEFDVSVPLYLGKIEKGVIYDNNGDSIVLKTQLICYQ